MTVRNPQAPGWVYDLKDYRRIFDIAEKDLKRSILDYPGGISCFNAQMYELGHMVISGDQIYELAPTVIGKCADGMLEKSCKYLKQHLDQLKENDLIAVEKLINSWQQNKLLFVNDYNLGKQQGRYRFMELPKLPFNDYAFELALCSDLLFRTQVVYDGPVENLLSELCRVAQEVRLYPLLTDRGEIAEELGPIMLNLQENNFGVEVREVPYDKRKGGNAMLRIWAKECILVD